MARDNHLFSTISNHHLPIFSLATFLLLLTQFQQILASQQPPSVDTFFDFIVVGGGTAGCAVASRLSENGRFTVLLLEAGGVPDPLLDIPALSADTINANPDKFMKAYKTTPQENAKLKENGIVTYLRGQTLGGGSSVNFMYFNRGSPFDYDQWANITGDQSWSYESMLRYFKKSEDYLGSFPSDQHGHGGPIAVQGEQYIPGLQTWLSAGKELGYPIADQNGPQRVSFIPSEFSKRNGRRVSSYTGYIKPIINTRQNLEVITNANVKNLVFDENKKCIGVNYTLSSSSGSTSVFVKSRKEVILSAGAIQSPVLLMRSGIGPKSLLKSANIPPVKFLPVGRNLQDHPIIKIELLMNNTSQVFNAERDLTVENLELFHQTGKGPYSSLYGFSPGLAFFATSKSENKNWPDFQLMYVASEGVPQLFPPEVNITSNAAFGEVPISVMMFIGRPKSRGSVTLNLKNPLELDPIIDFNYFTESDDMNVMIEGIQKVMQVFETNSYRKLGARLSTESHPQCTEFRYKSIEYWTCYVKQVSTTGLHGAGTCAMGRGENAVVNSKLRIIGVEGLRVVDASIMPTVTNSNLQASVYGIAEKASDMILESWS